MSSTACDDRLTVHQDEKPQRHKWADVIIALANGDEIEYLSDGVWRTPIMKNPIDESYLEWRIKPRTINIGDMEVPEPLREAPSHGTQYYNANVFDTRCCAGHEWRGGSSDLLWLNRGLLHLTQNAAIAHAKALIAVSGGTF